MARKRINALYTLIVCKLSLADIKTMNIEAAKKRVMGVCMKICTYSYTHNCERGLLNEANRTKSGVCPA